MFFWLISGLTPEVTKRTIIWLNGGPGCSSLVGAFLEIGPFKMTQNGSLIANEGSWHELANVVFVDNPLGTGFSPIGNDSYASDLDQISKNMVEFLEVFFEVFPHLERSEVCCVRLNAGFSLGIDTNVRFSCTSLENHLLVNTFPILRRE